MAKGFSGLPGGMGNLQGLLKQAQKMQKDLEEIQAKAEVQQFESSSGGGAVKAVVNGKMQLVELVISPELVAANDADMLRDTLMAALNDSLAKAQAHMKDAMGKVTGGMSLPGMF